MSLRTLAYPSPNPYILTSVLVCVCGSVGRHAVVPQSRLLARISSRGVGRWWVKMSQTFETLMQRC